MQFSLTVDLDPAILLSVIGRIPAALDARQEPMRGAFSRASHALMEAEEARYVAASGGDGTWRELSPVTKRKRLERQAKLAGSKTRITERMVLGTHMPILFVFGDLEKSLFEFGAPGHFQTFDASGVSEGAGDGQHPDAKMSFGALARIHHYGAGRIPARPVMGEPNGNTVGIVGSELAAGVNSVFQQLAAGLGGEMAQIA